MYLKPILLMLMLLGMAPFIHAQTKNTMETTTRLTEQQQSVLDVIESMTSAFHQQDLEGVMATYEPQAVVVFEPGSPVSDQQVLREMFKAAFSLSPQFEYSGHEVFINGDIATHFSPWVMTGKAPDGTEIRQTGLSVAVLRRQPNGSWLMIFDNPHGQFLMQKQ